MRCNSVICRLSFWLLICRPLQVGSYKDITVESMALFHMLEPRIGEIIKLYFSHTDTNYEDRQKVTYSNL